MTYNITLKRWAEEGIGILVGISVALLVVAATTGITCLGMYVYGNLTECSPHEYSLIKCYQKDDPAIRPLVKRAMENDVITQYEFYLILTAISKNSERILEKRLGDIKKELK